MFNIKSLTPSPSPRGEEEKTHPQPLSKGRGEIVSLEGAIVRTGLTDNICEICEICGTRMRVSKKTRMTRITRIVRIGLTDKICEICEICGTRMERKKASPPAPLQGERGGSKLRGCDRQDRTI
ncbi:MAG: hypothetical protein PUE86_08215 [Prevotella sp.]|nr:hypothetical protein [Prevotella sp.]